jgi:hypothetical protein
MSPTGVLVAWALMWTTSEMLEPLCSIAPIIALAAADPSGSGAVM